MDARAIAAQQAHEANERKRTALNDTGAHVLKGAVASVFPGSAVTTLVQFSTPVKGTLQVRYVEAEKPTDAQLAEIERVANSMIQANVPVHIRTLARAEAEAQVCCLSSPRRNDLHCVVMSPSTPPPPTPPRAQYPTLHDETPNCAADATMLSVVDIPQCTVNCCSGMLAW